METIDMSLNLDDSVKDIPSSVSVTQRFSIPKLNKDSLSLANASSSPIANNGTQVSNSNTYTLVTQDGSTFGGSGGVIIGPSHHLSGCPSPSQGGQDVSMDSSLAYAMMQQQVAAAAAAHLEHDYIQTRSILHQAPRNVLLSVLMSLVDEFPAQLVSQVHMRLEQFMGNRSSQSPTEGSGAARGTRGSGTFAPNVNSAPWTPSSMHGSKTHRLTPTAASTNASPTQFSTSSPGHRKGRSHKNKEEQEMCSVHHNMRAVKHLHLNPSTGLFECVMGYHCLVDGPAVPPSPAREGHPSSVSDATGVSRDAQHNPPLIFANQYQSAIEEADRGGRHVSTTQSSFSSHNQTGYSMSHTTTTTDSAAAFSALHGEEELGIGMNDLQNLLQCVRAMDDSD